MTQEQKAKAYDEAIERVKDFIEKQNPPAFDKDLIGTIFPELKESEDERIKRILQAITRKMASHLRDIFTDEEFQCFDAWSNAWLKKQGKETSWKPSKEEMNVLYGLAYITNQYNEHKEEVITRLYQDLKREFFNGASYENMFPNTGDDVRRRSTIQVLEYARSLDVYNQYGKADIDKNIAWLEKQGEQKPTLPKWKYKKDHTPLLRDSIILNKYGCVAKSPSGALVSDVWVLDYDELAKLPKEELEKQGEQKPTNKVEPKFKVGDWVVQGDNILKIKCVGDTHYCFETVGGYVDDMLVSEIDSQFHLWTIQDAKDGDVLVDKYNNIGIFQACEGMCWHSYIYLGCNNELYGFGIGGSHEQTNTHPATKERNDTLMKAMADAGYTFDFEKKELKKIDNEIEIPFGAKDSELQEVTYYIPKGFYAEIDDDKVVIKKGEPILDFKAKDWYVSKVDGKIHNIYYSVDKVDPKYNIGDVLCDKSCTMLNKESQPNFEITDIRNGMYICDKCSFPISQQDEYELVAKRIEQKPAWSEEDDYNVQCLVAKVVSDIQNGNVGRNQELIDWLKSLKQKIGG